MARPTNTAKKTVVQLETKRGNKINKKKEPVKNPPKKRWRPGVIAMREIKKYQRTHQLLVSSLLFKLKL